MGDFRKETRSITFSSENSRTILKTDSVVDSVIDSFVDRASFGKQKYGTNMDREDLSLDEWLEHAIQESMDHILYLKKIQQIVRGKK
jgi:hypothetical protein